MKGVDCALGSLHRMDVNIIADVSEMDAATIFTCYIEYNLSLVSSNIANEIRFYKIFYSKFYI
jgi:hypothetical protein